MKSVKSVLSLREALENYTEKPKGELRKRREEVNKRIEQLLQVIPYKNERGAWGDTLYRLCQEYMRLGVMEKYKRLSPEIFSLSGPMLDEVTVDKGTEKLKEPVVLNMFQTATPTNKEVTIEHKMKELEKQAYMGGRYIERVDLKVSIKVPQLTEEGRAELRKTRSFMYRLFADASEYPVMAQVTDRRRYGDLEDCIMLKTSDNQGLFDEPTIWTMWRPALSDYNVEVKAVPPPDKDPALVMGYNNAYFVVTTWDIPQEQPFRHFLTEFGIADAK